MYFTVCRELPGDEPSDPPGCAANMSVSKILTTHLDPHPQWVSRIISRPESAADMSSAIDFGDTPSWTASTPTQANESSNPTPDLLPSRHEPVLRLNGGRTAWIQVLGSFLINMNVYGLVNSFGDFQHFYETEYFASYSSSTISWIGTVQGSLALFTGAVAGPIFDMGHFQVVLRVASVFLVLSWMMLSLSSQYYQVSVRKRDLQPSIITTAAQRRVPFF